MRFALLLGTLMIATASPALAAMDSAAAKPKELRILRITPEGENTPVGRQIVIQFNRPVVPVGSMERTSAEIPVTIEPSLECQWRWLNTSALSCNLDEKNQLQEATAYHVTVNPGIKTEDGTTIGNAYEHTFTTERPDVRYSWFHRWLSPSTATIRLTFNQSVTRDSVMKSLYMIAADNSGQEYALRAEPDPDDRELPNYLPVPGTKMVAVFDRRNPQKSDEDFRRNGGLEARRVWLVTPEKELPLDRAMSLRIRPGLVSALGDALGNGEREVVQFQTFPEFKFLGVKCFTNEDEQVLMVPDKPDTQKLCNPMRGSSLIFSSPILRSQIKRHVKFTPSLNVNAEADPWGEAQAEEDTTVRYAHTKDRTYEIWLPSGLKAATRYQFESTEESRILFKRIWYWLVSLFKDAPVTDLQDMFGRPLQQHLSMAFETNHRKPNFEITNDDAVIEKQADSEVPLYVNNLTSTTFNYRKLTAQGATAGQVSKQTIPNARNIQFAIPFDVRGMLGGKSGAVYGHLDTDPGVKKNPSEHRLFAQVTPYQLHLKLGHFNSTVWVTDMATGAPVSGATVSIVQDNFAKLGDAPKPLSRATTGEDGVAVLAGAETIDPELDLYSRWNDTDQRLFVRVEKDGDMALLPVSYMYLINAYRTVGESVYYENKERYGHLKAWGMTAQGIYRAGDTIQYKLYVRNQDNRTLTPAPKGHYRLEITDPTGNKVEEVPGITLNEYGAYGGEFTVPKQGAVGWYQFELSTDFAKDTQGNGGEPVSWYPIRVLVSDFTPSPFKVTNQINGDLFNAGQQVDVATQAKLHSGGAYSDANVRVTAMLQSKPFVSTHPIAKDFTFGTYDGNTDQTQLFQKIDRIGDTGENALSFTLPPQNIYYGRLMVESAVQDDRGKYVAAQSYADYAGVDRFVGLRTSSWMFDAGKPAAIQYVVADPKGNPVPGSTVNIVIERQETKVAKVKGAGNAYVSEFTNEWVEAGKCEGESAADMRSCDFTPEKAGYYRATATVRDTKGNEHRTGVYLYVVGGGHVVWNEPDDYSLEIIPEKPTYKVGDKARYLVKNPYPGAKALVTVERYGVIEHFVQTLEGSTPVIEFEVKPDYIPGFYLSVVVFSPRVDKPIQGQVDLGKPTFRIGYVTVPIKDAHKEMLVTAKSDREVYKPRETVKLKLHAEPRFKDKKEPVELAVAVLDESVFDLVAGGRSYFDPYLGFYALESLDLRNYSLLTRLVGRQKFEKKGANPGGDGGSDLAMRHLFKFVSYWNPSLPTDSNGNATVEFEVPDNLTGWRVLAMAVTPSDRMGLGEANFKVNRPTEIRPVMPNQVTEGDNFDAGFSVMNRTDKARDITVKIQAEGDIKAKKAPAVIQKIVSLEPYKRTTVWMPLTTSSVEARRGTDAGEIDFYVTAEDTVDGDAIEHTLPVHKRRALETAATYGTTTEDHAEESIAFPKAIHADVGEVSVVAAPSVIGNVEGAFSYLRDYPYSCWEQLLTRAMMASHYVNLKSYMPKDFAWDGAEQLPDDLLKRASGFQAPSGGMVYFVPQDEYVDPYLSAYTALAFNWLKKSGYTVPDEVERRLHSYLETFLRQDVYPDFYDAGMASTVRAVALAALAQDGSASIADLERYQPHLAQMSLFGKTYFLQAAMHVEGGQRFIPEVTKQILGHANQSGGKFTFSEELDDSYSRILSSPLRENCAILSTFTELGEREDGKDLVEDVPFKLVRMITQARGSRTHWENTQENLFCMNALTDYARVYEQVKPAMEVTASLDSTPFGKTSFTDVKDSPVTFTRAITADDPGRHAKLTLEREGDGRLYYTTRLQYAPLADHENYTNAGIEIRREYSVQRDGKWQLLTSPAQIKQSELVRVDIYVSLPAAREFVVVDDPVPGGLEPVNRDLATASVVDADAAKFEAAGGSWWFKYNDWTAYNMSRWNFYHQELRHDSVRFYSDYLPAGNYHLSYSAQAIAPGNFTIMPVKAEEMYDPDVYGKGVSEQLSVSPQPQ